MVTSAGLQVAFYDGAYRLQGYANDYVSCSVTFQYLDTGAGSLVLPETHPMVALVLQAGNRVVPVTVTNPVSGARWSGRVDQVSVDAGNGSAQTVPGAGIATVTLVDEWPWMKRMLAAPWGGAGYMAYPGGAPEFDQRSGPVDTVVKGFISSASERIWGTDYWGNLAGPVRTTSRAGVDTSPTVTVSAKWTPLADLVTETLRVNNRALALSLWLPGDPQPAGLSLTAATIVADVVPIRNDPVIAWTEDTFLSRKVAVRAPTARTAITGNSGTGTMQVFSTATDADLAASLGEYGFPEAYFSASQGVDGADMGADAAKQIETAAGGVAISATVQDGVPWVFGVDYSVGDIVGVRALGLDIRQRVVRVEWTDDRANGLVLVPTIGDDTVTLTAQQKLFRTVRSLGARVQQLQTGA